jgi:putative transposase
VKKKLFSAAEIAAILERAQQGTPLRDLLRQHGISQQRYGRWKKARATAESSGTRQLQALQQENAELKCLVADLASERLLLQAALQNKH